MKSKVKIEIFDKNNSKVEEINTKNIITNDGDLYYAKKIVGEDTSGDFPSKHLRLGILGEKSIVDDPDPFGDGSCLATYPFDEDINDLTGNRNLTLKQGTTTYSSAHFDNGLEFDGNTYLQRNEAIFGSDGEQGTISVWVYVGENNAGNYVFQTAPDNDTAKISITSGTDSVAFLMRENGYGTQKAISKDELAQGFHHVVGIFDSTSFSLYVDNEFVGTEQRVSTTNLTRYVFGCDVSKGGDNGNSPEYFYVGKLDQARLFNRPLSEEEIESLYNETVRVGAVSVDEPDPFQDSSGLCLWQLDGDATDKAGNYDGYDVQNITYTTGKFGQAAEFNGSDSRITVFDRSTTESFLNQDFTYSFWVRAKDASTPLHNLAFAMAYSTSSSSYPNEWEGCYIKFDKDNAQIIADYMTTTDPYHYQIVRDIDFISDDSEFHHIAVTFDKSENKMRLYIDGEFEGEKQISGTRGTYDHVLTTMGCGVRGDNSYYYVLYYTGLLDQVRYFTRPLEDEEVRQIYKEIAAIPNPQPKTATDVQLPVYSSAAEMQEYKKKNSIIYADTFTYTDSEEYNIREIAIVNDSNSPSKALNLVQLTKAIPLRPQYSYRIKVAHIFEEYLGENIVNNPNPFNRNAVGLWTFDDTYDDVSGTWTGTPYGSASFVSGGKFGKALNLLGSSGKNYVHLGNLPPTQDEKLTISIWLNLQTTNSNWTPIFQCSANNADNGSVGARTPAAWVRPNEKRLHIKNDGVSHYNLGVSTTSFELRMGVWEHIVVTVEKREMRVYYNGELKDVSQPSEDFYFAPNYNYTYMGNKDSSQRPIVYIDQFRYFNDILTEEEIKCLFYEKFYTPFIGD